MKTKIFRAVAAVTAVFAFAVGGATFAAGPEGAPTADTSWGP